MPEFKYAKGRIGESLQFITEEIKEFESEYANKTLREYQEDKKLQKLMDRTVENILTALIEVCGTILVQESIDAENYGETLAKCSKLLGLSLKEQEHLSKLSIQRNRLAHRYLNFRWQAIKMYNDSKNIILKLIDLTLDREKKRTT
ncbi:MAG: DUF86 domain-containing protein [Planctomycetes bacterium]|nr:DUF86 domain-containing protein [Planctomycetota bacterium]